MAGIERSGAVAPNLVDRLRRHAELQPDARALRFLDGDRLVADLTYRELDARIRAVAAHLQDCAPPGERAVLLFPSSVDYVLAFYACLYVGLIAVPAYPPERGRAQHAQRLASILKDAEPRLVLTTSALADGVAMVLPPDTTARIVATDAVPAASAADWRERSPHPDSLAFLQYTSGSTSSPKGVRVSHANLDANEVAFTIGFGMTRDDVFVSWLPLFHDMGLIGGLLQPLHLGIPAILTSPQSFVERPRRWLDAFARFGGTVAGAPDFAYALCTDRISEATAAEIDLSGWRLAFSGAEFVRAATLERFARRFAASGFSPSTFFPAYGLAEGDPFRQRRRPRRVCPGRQLRSGRARGGTGRRGAERHAPCRPRAYAARAHASNHARGRDRPGRARHDRRDLVARAERRRRLLGKRGRNRGRVRFRSNGPLVAHR